MLFMPSTITLRPMTRIINRESGAFTQMGKWMEKKERISKGRIKRKAPISHRIFLLSRRFSFGGSVLLVLLLLQQFMILECVV